MRRIRSRIDPSPRAFRRSPRLPTPDSSRPPRRLRLASTKNVKALKKNTETNTQTVLRVVGGKIAHRSIPLQNGREPVIGGATTSFWEVCFELGCQPQPALRSAWESSILRRSTRFGKRLIRCSQRKASLGGHGGVGLKGEPQGKTKSM